jgi:hypothetical protein
VGDYEFGGPGVVGYFVVHCHEVGLVEIDLTDGYVFGGSLDSDFYPPEIADHLVIHVGESALLSLLAPNGGEVLNPGGSYTITWSSDTSISEVLVEYSSDNGQSWNQVAVAPNTEAYEWLVPAVNSNQCLVRVSNASDTDVVDISDGPLTIGRTIHVETPNGQELLTAGDMYAITWSNTGAITHVLIEYSSDNAQSWNDIRTVPNSGSYEWQVPTVNSDQCLVRIGDVSVPAVFDISDGLLTIGGVIHLGGPNGREVLRAGHTYTVTWSSSGVTGEILIQFSINAGQTWNDVDVVPNSGSYDWVLPAIHSNQCVVRVQDATDPNVSDASETTFAIQIHVAVPNVVGMAEEAAVTTINSAGLTAGNITHAYSDTVPEGDVISQNPGGATSVPIDSPVNLVTSMGKRIPTPTTIYVDNDSPGPVHDGSSWAGAYHHLQDGLVGAIYGDEIRVAGGVYRPDARGAYPGGTGNRGARFELKTGVAICGGYGGFGEPDPNARDTKLYETILSGDLSGNDVDVNEPCDLPTEPTRGENSYHVVASSTTDATAVLDGFTITGGNANGDYESHRGRGGGMYNYRSSPTVKDCVLIGNSASYGGGGVWTLNGSPTLTNCTLVGNRAGEGGGMYNRDVSCRPVLTNCVFSGNFAAVDGGGLYNHWCSPTLVNCTLWSNVAINKGGGMYNDSHMNRPSSPILTNCILWGNSDKGVFAEFAQIRGTDDSSVPIIDYCCLQGWTGALGGTGNTGGDPLFVDADGEDNVAGTADDNLRLLQRSPCLDAGDNEAVPPEVIVDLDGNDRFVDDTDTPDTGNGLPPLVDIGAYEGAKQGFLIRPSCVRIPEGRTATFTVALAMDPLGPVQVTTGHEGGDIDIAVVSGGSLTFDSSDYWQAQVVTLAAEHDDDLVSGVAQIWVSAPGFATAVVSVTELEYLFVDCDANGENDGTSWEDAFNYLQDALSAAPTAAEIRVAAGIYKPDRDSVHPNGTGYRDATFRLKNWVTIKGGYAGFGESDANERDIDLHITVLSGDLDGDDGPGLANNSENSYHVVVAHFTDETAVLDGFTISRGNSSCYGSPCWHGGGMYNSWSSPTVTNCNFERNSARYGGGIYNCRWSKPTLTNCVFRNNRVWTDYWSHERYGGAMFNNSHSSPMVINCVFSRNRVDGRGRGGAMHNAGLSSPTIANSVFVRNSAEHHVGGINNGGGSNPTITNCIFWDNRSKYDPTEELEQIRGSSPIVNYCCIQGWSGILGGVGNFGDDPCFVSATAGDFHLLPWSPCIDAGDNNGLPADTGDLDGDGNTTAPIPWDLDGHPRAVDGDNDGNAVVDMGAYEANYVEVWMKATPHALNPDSQGNWFKLHFVLPDGFDANDVDVNRPAECRLMDTNSVIESDYVDVFVNKDGGIEIEAGFERSAFSLCLSQPAERIVTVLGLSASTSGQYFYGTDKIKIVNKTWEQIAVLSAHWLATDCGRPDWCGGWDLDQDGGVDFGDFALFDGCCIEVVSK